MTTDPKQSDISMEALADVAGGSKNMDNSVVQTVIDSFKKTVKAGQDAHR